MPPIRLAAASAHFGRDLHACLFRIMTIVEHARDAGAHLLVLPHAALGGYLADLRNLDPDSLPPALGADSEVFTRLRRLAGENDMVMCVGYTERAGDDVYNSAVCLSGDGTLGRHRKVHLPPGETLVYSAGDAFDTFDTPVGRLGMLIDYDKTFPEAARTLAAGGGRILAFLSAWPASVTRRASSVIHDRQTRLFDLYDAARAAENQVVVVSANQTGNTGGLRFIGHTKIVGPGGESLARTGVKAELVVAEIDVDAEITRARRVQHHLRERRPDTYATEGQKHRDHAISPRDRVPDASLPAPTQPTPDPDPDRAGTAV
jgi:predicted amidohydrolase